MSSRKETKVLFEGWRRFINEAEEGNAPEQASDDKKNVIHIYDFDGVIGTFSPNLKKEFIEYANELAKTNPEIKGTPIQFGNTLALAAAYFGDPRKVAEHYELIHKPQAPYYVVSKFSKPVYLENLKYLKELLSFLSQKGLMADKQEEINLDSQTKEIDAGEQEEAISDAKGTATAHKAAVIRHVLKLHGAPKPSNVYVVENKGDDSKKSKANQIALLAKKKGKNPKNTKFIIYSKAGEDVKEAKMIANGLKDETGFTDENIADVTL